VRHGGGQCVTAARAGARHESCGAAVATNLRPNERARRADEVGKAARRRGRRAITPGEGEVAAAAAGPPSADASAVAPPLLGRSSKVRPSRRTPPQAWQGAPLCGEHQGSRACACAQVSAALRQAKGDEAAHDLHGGGGSAAPAAAASTGMDPARASATGGPETADAAGAPAGGAPAAAPNPPLDPAVVAIPVGPATPPTAGSARAMAAGAGAGEDGQVAGAAPALEPSPGPGGAGAGPLKKAARSILAPFLGSRKSSAPRGPEAAAAASAGAPAPSAGLAPEGAGARGALRPLERSMRRGASAGRRADLPTSPFLAPEPDHAAPALPKLRMGAPAPSTPVALDEPGGTARRATDDGASTAPVSRGSSATSAWSGASAAAPAAGAAGAPPAAPGARPTQLVDHKGRVTAPEAPGQQPAAARAAAPGEPGQAAGAGAAPGAAPGASAGAAAAALRPGLAAKPGEQAAREGASKSMAELPAAARGVIEQRVSGLVRVPFARVELVDGVLAVLEEVGCARGAPPGAPAG
jgi:hypothetical protein